MEQKERLLFRFIVFAVIVACFFNCTRNKKKGEVISPSFLVDTVLIPLDTVLSTANNLKLDNGIFYLNNLVFSGYIKENYPNYSIKLIGSFYKGMQHGKSVSYYPNGKTRDIRMYRANKSYGKQIGFWENGNQKFEFYYLDDKREGLNKQWYVSGQPYAFLTFKDDKEEGMQQAWRENGKPYINYEVKDGFRYGLQKSNLCYTLEEEKFKSIK